MAYSPTLYKFEIYYGYTLFDTVESKCYNDVVEQYPGATIMNVF